MHHFQKWKYDWQTGKFSDYFETLGIFYQFQGDFTGNNKEPQNFWGFPQNFWEFPQIFWDSPQNNWLFKIVSNESFLNISTVFFPDNKPLFCRCTVEPSQAFSQLLSTVIEFTRSKKLMKSISPNVSASRWLSKYSRSTFFTAVVSPELSRNCLISS